MTEDAQAIRVRRMVYAREKCFTRLREVMGHLPRPVISAVFELCDTLYDLNAVPDAELSEDTVVHRRP